MTPEQVEKFHRDAAIAAMAELVRVYDAELAACEAVNYADALVAEYLKREKKREADNAN